MKKSGIVRAAFHIKTGKKYENDNVTQVVVQVPNAVVDVCVPRVCRGHRRVQMLVQGEELLLEAKVVADLLVGEVAEGSAMTIQDR